MQLLLLLQVPPHRLHHLAVFVVFLLEMLLEAGRTGEDGPHLAGGRLLHSGGFLVVGQQFLVQLVYRLSLLLLWHLLGSHPHSRVVSEGIGLFLKSVVLVDYLSSGVVFELLAMAAVRNENGLFHRHDRRLLNRRHQRDPILVLKNLLLIVVRLGLLVCGGLSRVALRVVLSQGNGGVIQVRLEFEVSLAEVLVRRGLRSLEFLRRGVLTPERVFLHLLLLAENTGSHGSV